MTKDVLLDAARRIARATTSKMEYGITPTPSFYLYLPATDRTTDLWQPLQVPRECAPIFNDGYAKDMIFGFIRHIVQRSAVPGCIFVSDSWGMNPTPAGVAAQRAEPALYESLLGESGFTELVRRGWIERFETINVIAQNETDVLILSQPYTRVGDSGVAGLRCMEISALRISDDSVDSL